MDNTHVIGLDVAGDRITRIRTSSGNLDVPANGLVFLGLGTIENTRMALNTLDRARGYDPHQLIGHNLMAHMRSNLTFRVPLITGAPPAVEAGFTALFDGTDTTFARWQPVGGGSFSLVDGMIVAQPGPELGLLSYAADNFANFLLRLDVRIHNGDENSGVFVRFRNPLRRVPDPADPTKSYVYANKAFVAVDTGFEVQLDDLARGDPARGIPDGLDQHRTGAIYGIPIGAGAGQQTYTKPPPLTPLTWHALELRVAGDQYTVRLDGNQTSTFANTDPARGQPGTPDLSTGLLGVQSHTGRVAFRNIRVRRLP